MPITRRQFELEIDTKIQEWMDKIIVFLAEHNDEAFTEEELCQHYRLPLEVFSDERRALDLALEKLVETQVAEKRIIRGTEYYAFMREEL